MSAYQLFLSQFQFDAGRRLHIGMEREYFLIDAQGSIVPQTTAVLETLNDPFGWGPELLNGQIECRTHPQHDFNALKHNLLALDNVGEVAVLGLGLRFWRTEVAPADIGYNIYPDVRYAKIVANILTQQQTRAACRVAGTHVHVGIGDMDEAIAVYNALASESERLSQLGDHSDGERLKLYRTVQPQCNPPLYENAQAFYESATARGFLQNPRGCYDLVRISVRGTVEVRVFGISPHIDEQVMWAEEVRKIAKGAM